MALLKNAEIVDFAGFFVGAVAKTQATVAQSRLAQRTVARRNLLLRGRRNCATLYANTGAYMKKDQNKLLGRRLKAARVSAGYSQEYAAEMLGVTRQSVSAWETGANCPSALQLSWLAASYCVCAHTLLFGQSYDSRELHHLVGSLMKPVELTALSTGE